MDDEIIPIQRRSSTLHLSRSEFFTGVWDLLLDFVIRFSFYFLIHLYENSRFVAIINQFIYKRLNLFDLLDSAFHLNIFPALLDFILLLDFFFHLDFVIALKTNFIFHKSFETEEAAHVKTQCSTHR